MEFKTGDEILVNTINGSSANGRIIAKLYGSAKYPLVVEHDSFDIVNHPEPVVQLFSYDGISKSSKHITLSHKNKYTRQANVWNDSEYIDWQPKEIAQAERQYDTTILGYLEADYDTNTHIYSNVRYAVLF
jgi:hypothetical protein